MLTGRRYLLALTAEQQDNAERFGAVCRAVWNTALEQRREYRRRGAFVGYMNRLVRWPMRRRTRRASG
ncbi:helix-turn-helix domain-containing protein [Asanoa sp. NPDC049518]|uniref:helix-turn-helix domain-containing protein n=1 Tax=unclassified Asanoa TaxID=2685164 RepID=UPI003427A17D